MKWFGKSDKKLFEHIEAIFDLANDAKNIGDYELSNKCFGMLMAQFTHGFSYFEAELETQDSTGECWPITYYDLFVIKFFDDYLNIPVPLVDPEAAVWLMKFAKHAEVSVPFRQHDNAENNEAAEIQARFEALVKEGGYAEWEYMQFLVEK